jgi:DNA-binding MarR family transcriptional regulator
MDNSPPEPRPDAVSGRFAYDGLERTIHEKARLSIMTSLAAHPEGLVFSNLKDLCSLTDGNLCRHLQTLQESGLVESWKAQRRNRPQTLVRLTDLGRRRFLDYIAVLEHVVADALSLREELHRVASSARPLSEEGVR